MSYNKWIIERVSLSRLADFNEENIDRALGMIADRGKSPRTANAYREVAYALGKWSLKVAKTLDHNPVAEIDKRDERVDTRKVRRSLTVDQACKLLRVCGPCKLSCSVQLWIGLRVSETAALEWRDLDLDGSRPAIQPRAATTKAKRGDVLPLHPDLANALAEARPAFTEPTDRVFKIVPTLRTFKRDLERAGVPFEDERGRTVDRHAMRTTFISWLGVFGADPHAQVILARHAPQGVTLRNYQDFGLFDLWSEIRKLPPIRTDAEAEVARGTGTDGKPISARGRSVVRPVVQRTGRKGVKRSATGRIDDDRVSCGESRETLQKQGFRRAGKAPGP